MSKVRRGASQPKHGNPKAKLKTPAVAPAVEGHAVTDAVAPILRERLDDDAADHPHQQNNIAVERLGDDGAGEIVASLTPTPPSNVPTITTPAVATVEYEDAVIQGKAIVARLERDWWSLCALAARTKAKYGQQTTKRFFADIGFPAGAHRLNVYHAWRPIFDSWNGTSDPGPNSVSFTVLRELQAHPDRAELLKDKPTMTKEDAQRHKRTAAKQAQADSDWRRDNIEKQVTKIKEAVADLRKFRLVKEPAHYRVLAEVVPPLERTQLVRDWRRGLADLQDDIELIENIDQHIATEGQRGAAEDEAAQDEAAARLPAYRAAAAEAAAALAHDEADGEADDDATEQEEAHNAD